MIFGNVTQVAELHGRNYTGVDRAVDARAELFRVTGAATWEN